MTYTFTNNYNEELAQYIDGLFTQDKAVKLPRETRLLASDSLVESYVKHTGSRPPSAQLGRLATLILRDELADPHPDKMSREEYPILSEEQHSRRQAGKHKRGEGGMRGEVSLKAAYAVAIDGRDYKVPTRRIKSDTENDYIEAMRDKRRKERVDVD